MTETAELVPGDVVETYRVLGQGDLRAPVISDHYQGVPATVERLVPLPDGGLRVLFTDYTFADCTIHAPWRLTEEDA